MEFKFAMMEAVKDKITGFTGVVTSRTEWLSGCIRYTVSSKKRTPEGKHIEDVIDEQQLVALAKPKKFESRRTGGPMPSIKKFSAATLSRR
jgi:hypothetical protein